MYRLCGGCWRLVTDTVKSIAKALDTQAWRVIGNHLTTDCCWFVCKYLQTFKVKVVPFEICWLQWLGATFTSETNILHFWFAPFFKFHYSYNKCLQASGWKLQAPAPIYSRQPQASTYQHIYTFFLCDRWLPGVFLSVSMPTWPPNK